MAINSTFPIPALRKHSMHAATGLVVAATMTFMFATPALAVPTVDLTCYELFFGNFVRCGLLGPSDVVQGSILQGAPPSTTGEFKAEVRPNGPGTNPYHTVIGRHAQPGQFGLYAEGLGFNVAVTAGARGVYRLDDVVVSETTPGAGPATVDVSLNLLVSATSYINWNYLYPEGAVNQILLSTTINGVGANGSVTYTGAYGGNLPPDNMSSGVNIDASGLMEQIVSDHTGTSYGNWSQLLSGSITTPLVSVPVNTPFSVEVDFAALCLAGVQAHDGGAYGYCRLNALDTMGFPEGGPVFNLPDGYTSSSSLWSNNSFASDSGGSAVPEPGTSTLLALGLAGLRHMRRRKAA